MESLSMLLIYFSSFSWHDLSPFLPLGAAAPVFLLIRDDFRYRSVPVPALAAAAVLNLAAAFFLQGMKTALINAALNSMLIGYLAAGIYLWLFIKRRRPVNPLRTHIGSGDLLFLSSVCAFFGFREFLFYLIASCLLALCWPLLPSNIRTAPEIAETSLRIDTIPLVSVAGTVFILYLFYKTLF